MTLKWEFVILVNFMCYLALISGEKVSNVQRVKRATALVPVTLISEFPFVVSITAPNPPDPTQGLGVIVHVNWVLTRDRIVYNYTNLNARIIKVKSDDVNVATRGLLHRAIKLVYHPSRIVNNINIMALVKVCPPFLSTNIVTLPAATATWPAGTSVTVLRWQNNLAQLQKQTATLKDQISCATMGMYHAALQVCAENMLFGVYDMGVPILSSTKVLIGIGTRRSLGSTTQSEGFEDISKYLGWINPTILT